MKSTDKPKSSMRNKPLLQNHQPLTNPRPSLIMAKKTPGKLLPSKRTDK